MLGLIAAVIVTIGSVVGVGVKEGAFNDTCEVDTYQFEKKAHLIEINTAEKELKMIDDKLKQIEQMRLRSM